MDGYLSSGLKPKKRLGQNFLRDKKVVADLVSAAEILDPDIVIEIGAGTGVLTKELAKRAGKVLAFELDRGLIPVLKKETVGFGNVEIVNQDFLKVDKQQLAISNQQFKIVGSIPYQITSPLIHRLLTFEPKPSLAVLLIQKEVAQKITARPPRANYLSNIVKLLGGVEIVRYVPKTAFWPVPEVDGAIVKFKIKKSASGDSENLEKLKVDCKEFSEFLHRGFQNPRKMLRSKFDPDILKNVGIAPTKRAQTLDFDEWSKLYNFTT